MTVEFTVPGLHGKDRPRFTRTGHVYTTKATADFEEKIRWCYRQAVKGPIVPADGPVRVVVKAYHPVPKCAPKYKRAAMLAGDIKPLVKVDIDNVAKLVMDALNGLAYLDDKQVVQLEGYKKYAVEPAVYVRVELNGSDAP